MTGGNVLNGKVILVTGGTGSFGQKFAEVLFKRYKPLKLIVFSRDEYKQYEMSKTFPDTKYPIRYFLGDVRDKARLVRAFDGVDYVIHAAALKQVPALEYNPIEAVKTNVVGADNIVDASIESGIKKVVALSTDKAVNPINLYGATKLVAEKIFVAANSYAGGQVKFSVVRYGNVVGSRGSVIPLFLSMKRRGIKEFTITDERMTRFWITLEQAVDLVIRALEQSEGGEVYVPMIPSMKITDLARAIEPDSAFRVTGIRPGEKIHETLISEDEAGNVKMLDGVYILLSHFAEKGKLYNVYEKCEPAPENFVYRSDCNAQWLTVRDLQAMIRHLEPELDVESSVIRT